MFQIQRAENLLYFSGKAYVLIPRYIFNQLLGNRGAAVAAAFGKQRRHRAERSPPVNALMFPEALVFNGDNRIFHGFWYFIVIHPHPVFTAVQALILHRVGTVVVRAVNINEACIIKLQLMQIIIHRLVLQAENKRDQ